MNLIIFISLLIVILLVFYSLLQKDQSHFQNEFTNFNLNRHNPLSAESYQSLYDFTFAFPRMIFTKAQVGGGTQRNGDSLIESQELKQIITEDLDLTKRKPTHYYIYSLGYNFSSKENFTIFTEALLDLMVEGCLALPVNGSWVLFFKDAEGKVNVSFDKAIFLENTK